MTDNRKLDPTGERAAATEAVETTPISGKEHEYRADGDHHPRQDAAAVEGGKTDDAAPDTEVQTAPHISQGIPGEGRPAETDSAPDGKRDRGPRA